MAELTTEQKERVEALENWQWRRVVDENGVVRWTTPSYKDLGLMDGDTPIPVRKLNPSIVAMFSYLHINCQHEWSAAMEGLT